jgi:hypothetical protein
MKEHGINAEPTTIIDGKIKVLGIPTFLGYVEMICIRN